MSTPSIKIDQAPLAPGVSEESRDDLAVGVPVVLTDTANGAGAYLWRLVTPPGSAATLSGDTTDTATFTPDIPGTYLTYLTFNTDRSFSLDPSGNKVSTQGGAGVKHRLGTRPLGTGEIFQYHPSAGFAEDFYPYFAVIDAVTRTVGAPVGTLYYSDALGDLERLAPGSAGQYLLSNGVAAPSWSAISVSHGSLSGLTVPGDHPQYLLTDGTRNVTGAMAFNAGLSIGGNTASDILLSTDPLSSSDLALVTAGYINATITEAGVPLVGPGEYSQKELNDFYDGSLLDEADIGVTSDGATITFSIQKDGGGDIHLRISEQTYFFDTTPAATIALTAGTDSVPQTNYIYLTESGGTVILGVSTSGWPVVEYSAIAVVYCQSAASLQADGPLKVHAYTDHLHNSHQGHLVEMNRWIRLQQATWFSGVAPADIAFASPDAYLSVGAGTVYQLHEHTFPSRDMSLGDPAWLVNDPTATYKRITTFDGITQLADGGIVENKWFSLVLWASVNQDATDCKLFINLPSGSYNSQSQAEDDANGYDVFAIPQEFKGTGFLIAKYIVKGKNSGLWEQGSKVDLRGQFPISSPGASGGTTDHGNLVGLLDVADHPGYLTLDGTRTMTGDLQMGVGRVIGPSGTAALPAYSFAANNSGMYWTAGNSVAFGVGGVLQATISTTFLQIHTAGTSAAPSLRLSDFNSGFYRSALNEIAVTTANTQAVRWDASQNQINAGDITLPSGGKLIFDAGYNHYIETTDASWIRIWPGGSQVVAISAAYTQFSHPIRPNASNARDIGASSARWREFYGRNADLEYSAVGAGETVGLLLNNNTLAAAGAQQNSPMSVQGGSGWKTDATAGSQRVSFAQQVIPVQGTSAPLGELTFKSSINLAGWVDQFKISSAGDATATGDLDAAGGFRRTLQTMYMSSMSAGAATYTLVLTGSGGSTNAMGWMVAPRAGSVVEMVAYVTSNLAAGIVDFWVQKSTDGGDVWADVWGSSGSPVLTLDTLGPNEVTTTTQSKDTSSFAAGDMLRIQAVTNASFSPPDAILASIGIEC